MFFEINNIFYSIREVIINSAIDLKIGTPFRRKF